MVVALNSASVMLLISVLLRSLDMALCYYLIWDEFLSAFFFVLEKPVMSPALESNGLMKKSCSAQVLVLHGVSQVCALLLCCGCSVLQTRHL